MRVAVLVLLASLLTGAGLLVLRAPGSYAVQNREQVDAGSSRQHLAGTDGLGRDRLTRTAVAMLLGLAGAVAASMIATTVAVGSGIGAVFAPSWFGSVVLYLADLFLTLPWIFLLMTVRAGLPLNISPARSAEITFLLLGLLGAPVFVRMNFARAKVLRDADWMVFGRAAGLRPLQLARRHLLPHLRSLFFSQFLVYVPVCVIAEANLGTLGLGVSQPLPSWGSMLLELQNSATLMGSRWVYLPIALLVIVLLLLELLVVEAEV